MVEDKGGRRVGGGNVTIQQVQGVEVSLRALDEFIEMAMLKHFYYRVKLDGAHEMARSTHGIIDQSNVPLSKYTWCKNNFFIIKVILI